MVVVVVVVLVIRESEAMESYLFANNNVDDAEVEEEEGAEVVLLFRLLQFTLRCFGQSTSTFALVLLNSPDSQSPPVDDSELDASGLSDGVCASANELILGVR